MKFWIKDLYQAMSTSIEIIIYGAGRYAKEVYMTLKKMGLQNKIKSFVVTDTSHAPSNIDEISVCSVKEMQLSDTRSTTVLIAVSDVYFSEVIHMVQKYKFKQIYTIKSFTISEKELEQAKDIEFLEYIRETYIWNQVSCMQEFIQENEKQKKWIDQRTKQDIDRKRIVFIMGDFHPRYVNIIGALIRKGYHIKILEYGNVNQDYIKNTLFSAYKIEYNKCSNLEELLFYALKEKPLVYYFQPVWGDCSWPQKMICHKSVFGKIVISLYDVMNDGYVYANEFQNYTERYVLENADGIVWRWFSKEFLEEKKGFVYNGKSIQFLDYCSICEISKNVNNDNILKLCMVVGDITYLLRENFDENNTYCDLAKLEHILEKIGNQENCIFHVFVGQCSEKDMKECKALEKKYFNVKFFGTMQHDDMIQKVSEYDFGCLIYNNCALPPDRGIISYLNYGSGYYNSVTNKLFDYISAGIPFIATAPYKLCQFFEQYEVVVKMNISNLDINYLIKNKDVYKEKAQKARVDLQIDNQIQKLIDFFEIL